MISFSEGAIYDAQIELAMAILLPIILLLIGLPLVFLVCRWRHRRRMDELNARERFLTYTGDLRAEHVGDSTLQVSHVSVSFTGNFQSQGPCWTSVRCFSVICSCRNFGNKLHLPLFSSLPVDCKASWTLLMLEMEFSGFGGQYHTCWCTGS